MQHVHVLVHYCVTHTHMLVVDEIMVALLDSDRREMIYCACGVLVNIMADSQYRDTLSGNGGVRKLVSTTSYCMTVFTCFHVSSC